MNALSKIASAAVLLATLAALPGTLVALRLAVDDVAAEIPRHSSALDEAEFWARAFGS